jgi:phage terminase large subunit
MRFEDTSATRKIFDLRKRIRAVAGGTSASKTISILVWCIDYAQTHPNELISVVSESFPHLEDGAIRDFTNIMQGQGYWNDSRWHGTKHEYTFESKSIIEFTSVDTYGKAHGPRRDVLFVNEANNLSYEIVDQLITRTRKVVWLDWNPSSEFWFYTDMLPNRKDIDFLTLTYKDNEALDKVTIAEIESHRHNARWWKVYGEGQLGDIEGRVYTGWQIIDSIPHEARLERRGLDFGYTNDPTALIAVYYYNGGYILDEELYQKGLSNKQIADFIGNLERHALVKADSAEPKSIDEIKSYGVNIVGVLKGKDSINNGIQKVQDQRISVTKRSTNLIKEYRNYMWDTDRDGKSLNKPIDMWNHGLDAVRYAFEGLNGSSDFEFQMVGTIEGLGGAEIPMYTF